MEPEPLPALSQDMEVDTRLIYKASSVKVASGRNTLSVCTLLGCDQWERIGGERFPVCSACRHTRYCTREHQRADWKRHKVECNELREKDKRMGILAASDKPTEAQIISNLLEDFVQLHESTFFRIFNYAYHSRMAAANMEVTRVRARANLKYHPGCQRNPAKAFHFKNLEITELSLFDLPPDALKYRADFKTNRKNDPEFIHCMRVVYSVDTPEVDQHSWAPIYKENIPRRVTEDWYKLMLRILENGIVLRKIKAPGTNKLIWASGRMVHSDIGNRWVWHERSLEEIMRSTGIKVPPIDIWCRSKKVGIIYVPEGRATWVAPPSFSWDDV